MGTVDTLVPHGDWILVEFLPDAPARDVSGKLIIQLNPTPPNTRRARVVSVPPEYGVTNDVRVTPGTIVITTRAPSGIPFSELGRDYQYLKETEILATVPAP